MSSKPKSAAVVMGAAVEVDCAAGAVEESEDFRTCLGNMAMLRLERQNGRFPQLDDTSSTDAGCALHWIAGDSLPHSILSLRAELCIGSVARGSGRPVPCQ
ncbi:hypothetical protein ACWFRM_03460 [Streptomyces sp. NPDC055144]